MNDTTALVERLLPCPFCGETMFLSCGFHRAAGLAWWQVECGCGVSGETESTKEAAILCWNTRPDTAQATRIKVLEDALRNLLDLDQRCGWHSRQADEAIEALETPQ